MLNVNRSISSIYELAAKLLAEDMPNSKALTAANACVTGCKNQKVAYKVGTSSFRSLRSWLKATTKPKKRRQVFTPETISKKDQ